MRKSKSTGKSGVYGSLTIIHSGLHRKDSYRKMWQQLSSVGFWTGEIKLKDNRGYAISLGVAITAVKNELQETTHYVAIYSY